MIFVRSRQKRKGVAEIKRLGDCVNIVKQEVLPAGFDIRDRGAGHAYSDGKLVLRLSGSLTEASDALPYLAIDGLPVHAQLCTENNHNVNHSNVMFAMQTFL